jgi:hypothetical protein
LFIGNSKANINKNIEIDKKRNRIGIKIKLMKISKQFMIISNE